LPGGLSEAKDDHEGHLNCHRVFGDAFRAVRVLMARLEPLMKRTMWTQATQSGNWRTHLRGIGIVIRVKPKTRRPTEVEFFMGGRRIESAPVTCTLEIAKRIALEVVDRQIAEDAAWANAEYRHNSDIWKKP
jgi:hypothetical protein